MSSKTVLEGFIEDVHLSTDRLQGIALIAGMGTWRTILSFKLLDESKKDIGIFQDELRGACNILLFLSGLSQEVLTSKNKK